MTTPSPSTPARMTAAEVFGFGLGYAVAFTVAGLVHDASTAPSVLHVLLGLAVAAGGLVLAFRAVR